MIKSIVIVGIGSFFGGALRYYLSTLIKGCCTHGFPWGTLTVNALGCLIFGMLFALFHKSGATYSPWCLLLTTGVCGGLLCRGKHHTGAGARSVGVLGGELNDTNMNRIKRLKEYRYSYDTISM